MSSCSARWDASQARIRSATSTGSSSSDGSNLITDPIDSSCPQMRHTTIGVGSVPPSGVERDPRESSVGLTSSQATAPHAGHGSLVSVTAVRVQLAGSAGATGRPRASRKQTAATGPRIGCSSTTAQAPLPTAAAIRQPRSSTASAETEPGASSPPSSVRSSRSPRCAGR